MTLLHSYSLFNQIKKHWAQYSPVTVSGKDHLSKIGNDQLFFYLLFSIASKQHVLLRIKVLPNTMLKMI